MRRAQFFQRLKATGREYQVADLAGGTLGSVVRADQTLLKRRRLTLGDFRAWRRNLDPTYIIRLFAEFETPLRLYWRDARKRASWSTIWISILIERVAAYRYVPRPVVDEVHEVRDYRNALVHQVRPSGVPVLTFAECSSRLCRFLSYLPPNW